MNTNYKSKNYGVDTIIQTRDGELAVILGRVEGKRYRYLVQIQDDNKYIAEVSERQIDTGNIKNPYGKEFYGVGYLGVGAYNSVSSSAAYLVWTNLMKRCYSAERSSKYRVYDDCVIDERWHSFQEFGKYYHKNCKDEYLITKDLLIDNCKVYSEDTCIFVPQCVEEYLTKRAGMRKKDREKACEIAKKKLLYAGFSDIILSQVK